MNILTPRRDSAFVPTAESLPGASLPLPARPTDKITRLPQASQPLTKQDGKRFKRPTYNDHFTLVLCICHHRDFSSSPAGPLCPSASAQNFLDMDGACEIAVCVILLVPL
uniref:Uncharacterized protein n=1 Tax=Plectus sambesii TaxID=2011161 RepID=A0A914X7V3_9BILA